MRTLIAAIATLVLAGCQATPSYDSICIKNGVKVLPNSGLSLCDPDVQIYHADIDTHIPSAARCGRLKP